MKSTNKADNASGDSFSERGLKRYLDLKKLNQLAEKGSSFNEDVIEAFIIHTPALLSKLKLSLEDGNAMKTSKLIHELKSSAKLFCIDELFDKIFELETSSVQIDMPEYMVSVINLIPQIELLIQELKNLSQSAR